MNHLTQVAPDCYERLKRLRRDEPADPRPAPLEAAWAAVRDGTVDTIGSDHAPHPRAAKESRGPTARPG